MDKHTCSNCRFADSFDYADQPSNPTDGVHCSNAGMLLWRIEVVSDIDCPDWGAA